MGRIRLIHWNVEEARACVARLRSAGHSVVHKPFGPDAVYATWRGFRGALRRAIENPPAEGRKQTRMAG